MTAAVSLSMLPALASPSLVARATPTASGAEPLYPLNHTFDSDVQPLATGVTSAAFDGSAYTVGTRPANSDFAAVPTDVASPTNGTFGTGDFSSWTTAGTPTIASDATHGSYGRLSTTSQSMTTAAFTVPSTAQSFVFEWGRLATNDYNWTRVNVLSGAGFTTSTRVFDQYCNNCGTWQTARIDATPFLGQSVELQFQGYLSTSNVGVDDVRVQTVLQSYQTSGTIDWLTEAGGNTFGSLGASGVMTSAPFTVDPAAHSGRVNIRTVFGGAQYQIFVRSGAGYSTSTTATQGTSSATWQTIKFDLSPWVGQAVEIRVSQISGIIGVDDVGVQYVDVPDWVATKNSSLQSGGGPSGQYVSTTGNLTSQPFTLPANIQQLTLDYKGSGQLSIFYFQLLRGPNFSTVTDLHGGSVTADPNAWKTLHVGAQPYAGETVKLRISEYWGTGLFDNAGGGEVVVPGWSLNDYHAVVTGTDASGTYVQPYDGTFYLKSSLIQTGIIGNNAQKYYAIAYDIGYHTGSLARVSWFNTTGQSWVVFQDAANSPTGYKTGYFYLAGFEGQKGYFVVQIADGGGKLYSIADNIARQQVQEPFSQKVGVGIDTSTGGFGYADRDLNLAGRMPLSFTRFYTGQSDRFGPLGYRWSHSYDTRLAFSSNDVGVVFGSGGEEFFKSSSGVYIATDPRVHDALVKISDGTYKFTTTNNLTYNFTATGRLTSIGDLNGNSTTLAYGGNGLLSTVTDPDGRALALAYDGAGRLTSVTAPGGSVTSYAYDGNGDLTSVTDATSGIRTFAYDKHRLTQAVDQNGKVLFTNTLDSVNRVTEQTDALGHSITLAYDTPAKGATQVTDPLGNAAIYYFDTPHRTTDKVDPQGHVVSYVFDASGNLQKVIDPLNNQWQFAYDTNGAVTSATDPLGNPVGLAYNAQHLPTTVTDARGNVTTNTYDVKGNLLTTTDALGHTTTFTYDGAGKMLTKTDALGHVETYTYDVAGNQASKTDALGHTWTYTYDSQGHKLSETDPLGHTHTWLYDLAGRLIVDRNGLNQQKTWLYDPAGHLIMAEDELGHHTIWSYDDRGLAFQKTDPAGKVTTYAYDANRRMTSETDPLGHTTTYTYDTANRLASVTDPTGGMTSYTYDGAGRVALETDPLNRTTSHTYDNAGRALTTTMPNGGVWTSTYDANGNLTVETDPLSHSTTHLYDAANRKTQDTDPLLHHTSYTYDAANRLTTTTDALGGVTAYAYDDADRMISATDPLGHAQAFGYNIANQRTTVTDAMGRTRTYGFDAAGRVVSAADGLGNTTLYSFDAAGRRTGVTRPGGGVTSYAYDLRGLLLSVTDALSHVTSYAYDDAGRRTSMTDPLTHLTTYTYDNGGRQTSITDATGGVIGFGYDAAGQQTSVTDANGHATTSTYNSIGLVLTTTDPLNHLRANAYDRAGRLTATTDGRNITSLSSYDDADRLTATTYPTGTVTYGYDAVGRRTGMTDATGSSTWAYDAAGRTLTAALPAGTVQYTYNAAGDRTSMQLPGSRTVTYAYDGAGRMASLTDWQSRTTTFGYDTDGRRTTVTLPNGVVSATTYDAAGRTTAVNHTLGANTLQGFSYNLDAAGSRTGVTSATGTESYTLDALSRITNVSYPGGSSVSYSYDHNGNRLAKTEGGATTNYTYDAAGELTSDGTSTYTYDGAGNLTARGGDSFSYDWASRMTGATVGGTATSYTYDGDGVRAGKTVGAGTPVTYLWDRESGLPLLVDDGASAYIQANGPVVDIDGAGTASYHLNDALDSTRGLADGSGTVTGTLDYDVFGATRSASGATSGLTFTGQQRDSETGFTFLRSRYLDPAVGRFITADSVQPNAPGTQGYNLYAHVANNPARWADPSGHEVSAAMLAIEGACFRTAWCAPVLINAEQRAALGGLVGLGGGEAVTFIVLACALDVTIERLADGEWHKGGCLTVAMELYDLLTGAGSSVTGPVVVPTSLPHSGGGGVNTSAGTDTGGQTAAPLPPFPPKGPGGNGYCLSDVLSWLAQIPGAIVKNAGGADGVETWSFKSPDGHEWELKIKRQGATSMDEQPGPRISVQDRTISSQNDGTPSFWDPESGTWGGKDSPQAHLGLDTSC